MFDRNRILFIFAGMATFILMSFAGERYYAKNSLPLISSLCSGDAGCLATMDAHYHECFRSSFVVGKRIGLYTEKFASCLNKAADEIHFSDRDVIRKLETAEVTYSVYK